MMSASEAAMKSNEVIKYHTEEFKKIEALIEEKVMYGRRYASYKGAISKNAREKLERLGYKVKTASQCNEEWVTIE